MFVVGDGDFTQRGTPPKNGLVHVVLLIPRDDEDEFCSLRPWPFIILCRCSTNVKPITQKQQRLICWKWVRRHCVFCSDKQRLTYFFPLYIWKNTMALSCSLQHSKICACNRKKRKSIRSCKKKFCFQLCVDLFHDIACHVFAWIIREIWSPTEPK